MRCPPRRPRNGALLCAAVMLASALCPWPAAAGPAAQEPAAAPTPLETPAPAAAAAPGEAPPLPTPVATPVTTAAPSAPTTVVLTPDAVPFATPAAVPVATPDAMPFGAAVTPAVPASPPSAPSAPAATPAAPLAVLPDPVRFEPEPFIPKHPLFRAVDVPARSLERPKPDDLEVRTTLMVTLHMLADGKIVAAVPVEPPLAALGAAVPALVPRWTFTAAKKGGAPVATWATYGVDLEVDLEEGVFSAFSLTPVQAGDPLPELAPESAGDSWITRYPREPAPADGSLSIEDVDVLPSPEKTSFRFEAMRARTRVRALVEVAATGAVARVAPIGPGVEPLVVTWLRRSAYRWRVSPAQAGGKPVASWLTLDATLEYTVSSAKEKGKRSIKKNLRGTPNG